MGLFDIFKNKKNEFFPVKIDDRVPVDNGTSNVYISIKIVIEKENVYNNVHSCHVKSEYDYSMLTMPFYPNHPELNPSTTGFSIEGTFLAGFDLKRALEDMNYRTGLIQKLFNPEYLMRIKEMGLIDHPEWAGEQQCGNYVGTLEEELSKKYDCMIYKKTFDKECGEKAHNSKYMKQQRRKNRNPEILLVADKLRGNERDEAYLDAVYKKNCGEIAVLVSKTKDEIEKKPDIIRRLLFNTQSMANASENVIWATIREKKLVIYIIFRELAKLYDKLDSTEESKKTNFDYLNDLLRIYMSEYEKYKEELLKMCSKEYKEQEKQRKEQERLQGKEFLDSFLKIAQQKMNAAFGTTDYYMYTIRKSGGGILFPHSSPSFSTQGLYDNAGNLITPPYDIIKVIAVLPVEARPFYIYEMLNALKNYIEKNHDNKGNDYLAVAKTYMSLLEGYILEKEHDNNKGECEGNRENRLPKAKPF